MQFPADAREATSGNHGKHYGHGEVANPWLGTWDSAHRAFGSLESDKVDISREHNRNRVLTSRDEGASTTRDRELTIVGK
jgi:hypothetical protein